MSDVAMGHSRTWVRIHGSFFSAATTPPCSVTVEPLPYFLASSCSCAETADIPCERPIATAIAIAVFMVFPQERKCIPVAKGRLSDASSAIMRAVSLMARTFNHSFTFGGFHAAGGEV